LTKVDQSATDHRSNVRRRCTAVEIKRDVRGEIEAPVFHKRIELLGKVLPLAPPHVAKLLHVHVRHVAARLF
jgi:hypothetical protein